MSTDPPLPRGTVIGTITCPNCGREGVPIKITKNGIARFQCNARQPQGGQCREMGNYGAIHTKRLIAQMQEAKHGPDPEDNTPDDTTGDDAGGPPGDAPGDDEPERSGWFFF